MRFEPQPGSQVAVQTVVDRGRSHVAALAKLVRRAAELGDAQARRIFDLAGAELADMVTATRRALVYKPY